MSNPDQVVTHKDHDMGDACNPALSESVAESAGNGGCSLRAGAPISSQTVGLAGLIILGIGLAALRRRRPNY